MRGLCRVHLPPAPRAQVLVTLGSALAVPTWLLGVSEELLTETGSLTLLSLEGRLARNAPSCPAPKGVLLLNLRRLSQSSPERALNLGSRSRCPRMQTGQAPGGLRPPFLLHNPSPRSGPCDRSYTACNYTYSSRQKKTVHVQEKKLEGKAAKRLTVTVRWLEFIIIWLDSLLRLRNICKI